MTPLLRLARVQNLPTAVADVVAGYLLWTAGHPPFHATTALSLAGASCALYSAGTILNDVADVGRDRTLHPGRPLVTGAVTPGAALAIGAGLLATGMLIAMSIGFGAIFVTTLIALLVVLYDFVLKRYRLPGCMVMGLLRGLNFALGMSAIFDPATPFGEVARDPLLRGPALLAGYVMLLTLLSTFEEGPFARVGVPATLVLLSLASMGVMALVPLPGHAALASLALGLWFLARASTAVKRFDAARTGLMVRDGVRAIPLFDGSIVLGHGRMLGGIAVMTLVLPVLLLGRWFKGS